MKASVPSILMALTFSFSAQAADVFVKLENVHVCCNSCLERVDEIVGKFDDVKGAADKDAKTIDLAASDTETVQKAVDALVKEGFFGTTKDSRIKIVAETGAKGEKVQSLSVRNIHLCCGACVRAVDGAMKSVTGVKEHTAKRGASSFTVTGDFSDKDVFDALRKIGLTGKVE